MKPRSGSDKSAPPRVWVLMLTWQVGSVMRPSSAIVHLQALLVLLVGRAALSSVPRLNPPRSVASLPPRCCGHPASGPPSPSPQVSPLLLGVVDVHILHKFLQVPIPGGTSPRVTRLSSNFTRVRQRRSTSQGECNHWGETAQGPSLMSSAERPFHHAFPRSRVK